MSLENLTIDDLTTNCPICNGTGKDPASDRPPANQPTFGRRVISYGPGTCPSQHCAGGKVPNEAGWTILEFLQVYGKVRRNSLRQAGG